MEKIELKTLVSYLELIHNDAKCELNYENSYQLLSAIMLSAQTTDKAVNKVTPKLFQKYSTINSMSLASYDDVEEIIKSIGLYHKKANNLINAMKKLSYLGYKDVPNDRSVLESLPGVGRKTTNVFLSEYYGLDYLGVDTHIMRISYRLGLRDEKDNPIKTEQKLLLFLDGFPPQRFHHLLIAFERNECSAKAPKCASCNIKKYCNYEGKK